LLISQAPPVPASAAGERPLHVAGAEVQDRPGRHAGLGERHGGVEPALLEVGQQLAEPLAEQPDLQRPGGVRVPDGHREVRDAADHAAAVDDRLRVVDLLAVDRQDHAAEQLQVEAGGGDDDVGRQVLAARELQARLGERVDAVGDHLRRPVAEGAEQVAVRDDAEPLLPRVVGRAEVLVDREALGQRVDVQPADEAAGRTGEALAEAERRPGHGDVATAVQLEGALLVLDDALGQLGERVDPRDRHDVGRRALQHGDLRAGLGQRRDERHGGGAAADDDDALAAQSRSSGQCCGWTTEPANRSRPANSACGPCRSGSSRRRRRPTTR
jgi:hypothetical protein